MTDTYTQLGLDSVLDDGTVFGTLLQRFYPLLLRHAYADAETMLGVALAFDLANPAVQQVLDRLALLVKSIAETTRADIQQLIGQQAANGWSMAELADALRARGVTESESRAMLISRTESAKAYSLGSELAWRASGVVDRKQWLLGRNPCPLCQPLGGTIVGLDAEFESGVAHPPLHPNCTCAISPVLSP